MEQFVIDEEQCNGCGLCVADCPAGILALDEGVPKVISIQGLSCFKCQHCLAVCPTGGVSILGRLPENSLTLTGAMPELEQMEQLYHGRRSVRQYQDRNLDKSLLDQLLQLSWTAPSGVNARQVQLTLVDDREVMQDLRTATYTGLAELFANGAPAAGLEMFASYLHVWQETGKDVIYRGAPHLLVASASKDCPTPLPDSIIMLSYFELLAQSQGVGTVWCGLARWTFSDIMPEFRERLGIPDDHQIGNVMAFGYPAVSYRRSVQHEPVRLTRVAR